MDGINKVLEYINSLYTVYTRIFLYDRDGVILATTGCSNAGAPSLVGEHVDAACLASVLRLADDQRYHVSAFAPTALHDGNPTYVYHAALRDTNDARKIVGGIGIVFDSAPEFLNMLKAGLGERSNMSAFFVDRNGAILSGTDPHYPIGSRLPLEHDLLKLANGDNVSRITVHDDQYAIVGCSVSSGNREFKVADGYQEDVIAVVIESLGAVVENGSAAADRNVGVQPEPLMEHGSGRDYAAFYRGKNLMAIDAACVRQALPFTEMLPASMGSRRERIGLINLEHGAGNSEFIWVFDLAPLMGESPRVAGTGSQVIVVAYDGHIIGLLVDELHAVPHFGALQITQMPFTQRSSSVLVTQVIKANQGALLVQLLDLERVFRLLLDQEILIPVEPAEPMLSAA